ncbi:RNA ligase-domain-containing protein [Cercophora newfieldiana]|uniref:RNA ligase-domain-containing protein n=1 Tax=Cercophora newfieldiana TaxID=92897 RepID=A0AA39YR32_9PEZI|nr:RNA ligase-domain-containing protein [Cercophora newfieldiana]
MEAGKHTPAHERHGIESQADATASAPKTLPAPNTQGETSKEFAHGEPSGTLDAHAEIAASTKSMTPTTASPDEIGSGAPTAIMDNSEAYTATYELETNPSTNTQSMTCPTEGTEMQNNTQNSDETLSTLMQSTTLGQFTETETSAALTDDTAWQDSTLESQPPPWTLGKTKQSPQISRTASYASVLGAGIAAPAPSGPSTVVKRKLVTVRRIRRIDEPTKMNGQVVLHIDGWTVVESKHPFMDLKDWKVGELVVFFEIDSVLPQRIEFIDLFSNPKRLTTFQGKPGYRVISSAKGKYLSQGLVFRLKHFSDIYGPFLDRCKEIGHKAASKEIMAKSFEDLLGVVKWELPEEDIKEGVAGITPAFVVNPSWYRAQNIEREIFAPSWRNKVWQVTEKLDGISMHIYKVAAGSKWFGTLPVLPQGQEYPASMRDARGHVGVCSRAKDFMDRPGNLFWDAAKGGSSVASKIWDIPYPNISVQGELCGSSIMGNTMELAEGEHRFVVFGIWNFDTGTYVNVKEVAEICKRLQIEHVPIIGYYKIGELASNMEELLAKANGKGTGAFGGISEGFVFRCLDGKNHFKVISNEWLAVTGK